MQRFKIVAMFVLAVGASMLFWGFVTRAFTPHHADNAAVQGLAALM